MTHEPHHETTVTFLGCGTSSGVPLLGNRWGACDASNPKNRRTRSSVIIERGGTRLLIDATPDVRAQLLSHNIDHIDALLITHCHADHIGGLDDLRGLNNLMKKSIDLYCEASCLDIIQKRIPYAFADEPPTCYVKPSFTPHALDTEGTLSLGAFSIVYFEQHHGSGYSTGFRFGTVAYCTDVSDLSPRALHHLHGVDVWIIDCLRARHPHPSHAILPQVLQWREMIGCRQVILTHLGAESDYESMEAITPPYVSLAWDGRVVSV